MAIVADSGSPFARKVLAAVKSRPGIDDEIEIARRRDQDSPVGVGQGKSCRDYLCMKARTKTATSSHLERDNPEWDDFHSLDLQGVGSFEESQAFSVKSRDPEFS